MAFLEKFWVMVSFYSNRKRRRSNSQGIWMFWSWSIFSNFPQFFWGAEWKNHAVCRRGFFWRFFFGKIFSETGHMMWCDMSFWRPSGKSKLYPVAGKGGNLLIKTVPRWLLVKQTKALGVKVEDSEFEAYLCSSWWLGGWWLFWGSLWRCGKILDPLRWYKLELPPGSFQQIFVMHFCWKGFVFSKNAYWGVPFFSKLTGINQDKSIQIMHPTQLTHSYIQSTPP